MGKTTKRTQSRNKLIDNAASVRADAAALLRDAADRIDDGGDRDEAIEIIGAALLSLGEERGHLNALHDLDLLGTL